MRISSPEWVGAGFISRRENAEQKNLGWEAQPSSYSFLGPALTHWFGMQRHEHAGVQPSQPS